jgi:trigger factor
VSEPLQVELSQISPVLRRVKVVVPSPRVGEIYKKVVQEYQRKTHLEGFRPGKAPLDVVEKKFREEIGKEAQNRIIQETLRDVIQQHKLEFVSARSFELGTFLPEESFTYTTELEVQPEVPIQEIPRLKLYRPVKEITSEDVEKAIQELFWKFMEYRPSEKEETLEEGDKTIMEMATRVPPEEFPPSTAYEILFRKERIRPEIYPHLLHMKVGEERTFAISYGEEEGDPRRRGKTIEYRVKLSDLKKPLYSVIDDRFVQDRIGIPDLESLREQVKKDLQTHYFEEGEKILHREVEKTLGEKFQFEVPRSLVEEELSYLVRQIAPSLSGSSEEERKEMIEKLTPSLIKVAENNVRVRRVLLKIAEMKGIAPTSQEVDLELSRLARAYNVPPNRFFQEAKKSGIQNSVILSLTERKTIEYLITQAEVEEIPWDKWESEQKEREGSS